MTDSAHSFLHFRTWRIFGFGAWYKSPTIGYQLYSGVAAASSLTIDVWSGPLCSFHLSIQYPWPGKKRDITKLSCVVTARGPVNDLIIICDCIPCRTSIDLRVELLRCLMCVSFSNSCVIPRVYDSVLSNQRLQCSALLIVIVSAVRRCGTVQIVTKDTILQHLLR
jgi:hypothetical protein